MFHGIIDFFVIAKIYGYLFYVFIVDYSSRIIGTIQWFTITISSRGLYQSDSYGVVEH